PHPVVERHPRHLRDRDGRRGRPALLPADPALPPRTRGGHRRIVMSDPARSRQQYPSPASAGGGGTNLGDILERVLDRGVVIAGDIRVNLLDIELLTIKLRLLIASVDTARELGIDWWEHDPW